MVELHQIYITVFLDFPDFRSEIGRDLNIKAVASPVTSNNKCWLIKGLTCTICSENRFHCYKPEELPNSLFELCFRAHHKYIGSSQICFTYPERRTLTTLVSYIVGTLYNNNEEPTRQGPEHHYVWKLMLNLVITLAL